MLALLGLTSGQGSRSQIVLVGVKNRVNDMSSALRIPGRFDRELIFRLPNANARCQILQIQTKNWNLVPPSNEILCVNAERTVGYCGAHRVSSSAEAALRALRRGYPRFYESPDTLLIHANLMQVRTWHFLAAVEDIVPSRHRSERSHAKPLMGTIVPNSKRVLR